MKKLLQSVALFGMMGACGVVEASGMNSNVWTGANLGEWRMGYVLASEIPYPLKGEVSLTASNAYKKGYASGLSIAYTHTVLPQNLWGKVGFFSGEAVKKVDLLVNGQYTTGRVEASMMGWSIEFDNPRMVWTLVKSSDSISVKLENATFKFTGNGASKVSRDFNINF